MRKKTLEELRATARERARRWRKNNAWKHREQVKELYGKSEAQKRSPDGVTEQEVERYGRKIQETYYALEPGVDVPYEAPPATPVRNLPSQRVVGYEGPMTAEHQKAIDRLEEMVARKKAGEGVEVEMP